MPEEVKKIKVFCAEDEAVIAMDLQEAINEQPDMNCVGWLPRADRLPEEVAQKQPDVVLLDLTMPGRDSLDALTEMAAACPNSRTIVFSGYADQALVDRAVQAGAWGYVVKNGDISQVINAIRQVAKGEFVRP